MTVKKKVLATFSAATLVFSLTACAQSSDTETAHSSDNTLVVYTNSNADGRAQWLTEEAKKAGFDIQIVGQGGSDTTNKLIAEQGNPVTDIVFGLNNMYFEQLESEDILLDYTPQWSDKVDEKLGDNDSEHSYWPLVQQGIVLAYNADKLSPEEAPQDWTDLGTKEKFHGHYQTESGLGGATTALVVAGILSRFRDDSGELGVSDKGWKQIESFFANGSPSVPDTDLYARMKDGEVDMGQMWSSGIPAFEQEYKITTGIVKPKVGVPYAVEQIGIVNGSDRTEQAQKFIDWFGSAQTQIAWSAQFNSMPANKDAIAQADPAIVNFHNELPQQDIDWDFVRENINSWIEKIELEYL
ncbi:extracellular solute-binding protein [Corynebacterium sp. sy017]|nr:extracellular solute-binding protein [Corynebacterium sp. sy017]TSD91804.1 extracellular solute-binding protein [Corynebacterium sp. SY003]